jgi:hypothetical protein
MLGAPRGETNGPTVWEGLEGVKSIGAFKSTMGGWPSCSGIATLELSFILTAF